MIFGHFGDVMLLNKCQYVDANVAMFWYVDIIIDISLYNMDIRKQTFLKTLSKIVNKTCVTGCNAVTLLFCVPHASFAVDTNHAYEFKQHYKWLIFYRADYIVGRGGK